MNNRNINIVDEHGIDRVGTCICAISLNGSEYCVYSIERDELNDNLFISKLLKDIDGTSKLVNFEDSNEKGNVTEVVKNLIKYTINDQSLNGRSSLNIDGNKIDLVVMPKFNKEQNITIPKTYISTVSKAVTKVAKEYFSVKEEENNLYDINAIFPNDLNTVKVEEPIVENMNGENSVQINDVISNLELPEIELPSEVNLVSKENSEPIPVISENFNNSEIVSNVNIISNPLDETMELPSFALDNMNNNSSFVEVEPSVSEVQNSNSFVNPIFDIPNVNDNNIIDGKLGQLESPIPVVENDSFFEPQSFDSSLNSVNSDLETEQSSDILFFDGSKESNLNNALYESSKEVLPVNDIESVREFGMDTPAVSQNSSVSQGIAPMVAPEYNVQQNTHVKTLTKKAGFVNSKFFVIIILLVFVGTCVFMGYEAFRYFNLK